MSDEYEKLMHGKKEKRLVGHSQLSISSVQFCSSSGYRLRSIMQAAVVVILNVKQRQRTVGITDASQGQQRRGPPPSQICLDGWILPFQTVFLHFNKIDKFYQIYSLNYIPVSQTAENSISKGNGFDSQGMHEHKLYTFNAKQVNFDKSVCQR